MVSSSCTRRVLLQRGGIQTGGGVRPGLLIMRAVAVKLCVFGLGKASI